MSILYPKPKSCSQLYMESIQAELKAIELALNLGQNLSKTNLKKINKQIVQIVNELTNNSNL